MGLLVELSVPSEVYRGGCFACCRAFLFGCPLLFPNVGPKGKWVRVGETIHENSMLCIHLNSFNCPADPPHELGIF